jgi:hypothetical protein
MAEVLLPSLRGGVKSCGVNAVSLSGPGVSHWRQKGDGRSAIAQSQGVVKHGIWETS